MNWIVPGIETNLAYGTCMLLFGLLFLSVRNRKMTTTIPYTFYATPQRGAVRPTPNNQSAQDLRRGTTPVHHSGLLLSTGLECTSREKAISKAPQNAAKHLIAPLVFPALRISEEAKKNSTLSGFENLDSITPAEISTFAARETVSTIEENILTSQAAHTLGEIELRSTRQSSGTGDLPAADERVSEK